MRKFITRFILFLLPILLLAIGLEVLLRDIPNDYKFKKNYLDQHAGEIETLILGSSHSFYGLDPTYFSTKTFNAGYSSQTLDLDYLIFKKYRDELKHLKTLLLPISYGTLWMKMEDSVESWRIKNYHIYYQLNNSGSIKYNFEISGNQLPANLSRIYAYYVKKQSDLTSNQFGWGTTYQSIHARDLIETGKSAALLNKINIYDQKHIANHQEILLKLNEIIQWCNNHGVNVLLYTPPAYETYRINSNANQLNITLALVQQLIKENKNCYHINLLNDPLFKAEDFYDANHLSELGAKKMSIKINSYLTAGFTDQP